MAMVKIGDTVMWRGCFGSDAPIPARVIGMELSTIPRDKYGKSVESATWEDVEKNLVVFDLDGGHWAYSDQISRA